MICVLGCVEGDMCTRDKRPYLPHISECLYGTQRIKISQLLETVVGEYKCVQVGKTGIEIFPYTTVGGYDIT